MTFQTSNGIEKPDVDDRSYKLINLRNGLKALLISDPKTDKSAAALDVNVGAFSDYEHLPGLAHFCEHLLFMGTKKYPSENEYSTYLSNHGGHSNAYTASEDTNYYFEVNHQYLEGALDRFSQFFIAPLFDPSCKDREIRAVDSENKKNLQNDMWRLYQLEKSLSNPVHPYHKFSTGNIKTLGEIPESQGVDVREELLKFYRDHYSANLMKLAVIGREDLDTLEKWVQDKFTDVPNFNTQKPTFDGAPYTAKELKKLIKAKPVMSKNKLSLSFVVPDHDEHWESQTSHFYSHLIGHEGSGSLYDYLKNKGFIDSLSSGGYTITKGHGDFGIDIELTETGLKNYEEIIYNTFQYIQLLKTSLPQKYIFDELKEVSEMNFKFKQKASPSSTVSKLAKDLQMSYIPDKFTLSRNVLRKYDPELIIEFGMYFTVDNLRVILVSQSVETDKTEKWYGTEYSIEDLSPELVAKLSKPTLNSHLHLPHQNDFIPTKFDVEKLDNIKVLHQPTLLKTDSKYRFWYKKDDQFWVPKGYINLGFILPATSATPYTAVLTSLFAELVEDELTDVAYQAKLAGLSFQVENGKEGLSVVVHGYNEKAPSLLKSVLKTFNDFKPKEDRFNVTKEKIARIYKNFYYKNPYNLVTPIFSNLLNDRSWAIEDRQEALDHIEFDDFKNFIGFALKQSFVEGLIVGNFQKADVQEIIEIVETTVQFSPLSDAQKVKPRSYRLTPGKTYRYDKLLPDEKNTNSCIQYFIHIGDVADVKLYAYTELLAQLIKEPAFDTLRTKEQLGYIVFSGVLEARTVLGLRLIIQSERNAAYLESRIVAFLKSFHETFKNMKDDEFSKHKEALISKKLESLKNLGQEYGRFQRHISDGYYDFLQKDKIAAVLKPATKKQLLEFYENAVIKGDTKLIVNLHPKSNTDDSKTEGFPTGEEITDLGLFKSSLTLSKAPTPVEEITLENFSPKL